MRLNRGRNMAALIEQEGLDENGQPVKQQSTTRRRSKRKVKSRKIATVNGGDATGDDVNSDDNYSDSLSDLGSDSEPGSPLKDDSDIEVISNDEVCSIPCPLCVMWC